MIEICDTCKLRHKVYDDGFDYLSCMLAIKQRDKANSTDTTKSRSILSITDTLATNVSKDTTKLKNDGFGDNTGQIGI